MIKIDTPYCGENFIYKATGQSARLLNYLRK